MNSPAIQRLPLVRYRTGQSRTSIYKAVKEGTFPSPIKLGARSIGWLESDITKWIESRAAASKNRAKGGEK